jgi:hypothetical protein
LGRGSSVKGFFGGEAARDRGEYEQLGKSLISYASTIPIRNQKEFDVLSKKLYDPNIPDKEAEGTLDSMIKILNDSISSFGEQQQKKEANVWVVTPKGKRVQIPGDQLEAALSSGGKRG